MAKEPISPNTPDPSRVDPALEAQLRSKIEAELRAEYEDKLRAAGVSAPVPPSDGKPAMYFYQQGSSLVGVPVIAAGGNLHDPRTGARLVTGAQSSDQPANGRYVLKS
jgi:hypothetical protein